MSDPFTTTSIATTIDPLEVLPNELFLQIFFHLFQLDICAASSINSKWRRILLSSPELYSTLHLLLQDGYLEESSQVQAAKANLQIKSLIKASQLSQHRIKELCLNAGCLVYGEYELVWSNWEASRFSTLIDVLSLSRDHLKQVVIDLPILDLITDSENLTRSCQMVCNLLCGLRAFDNLNRIDLTASILIGLKYQSDNKLLVIGDYEQLTDSQSSMGHRILLERISGLWGDYLTDFELFVASRIDSRIVGLLEKSKNTLKKFDLGESELVNCHQEFVEFITSCPNLETLEVKFPELLSNEEARPTLRFFVPPSFNHVSKLKHVVFIGDLDLSWEDQSLYDWFGKRLMFLNIDVSMSQTQESFLNQPRIPSQLFSSFLRPLSSTLVNIQLEGLFVEATRSREQAQDSSSEGNLEMEALKSIYVGGNAGLINVILKSKCANFKDLTLKWYQFDGDDWDLMDTEVLKEFLKHSSPTLNKILIQPYSVKHGKTLSTSMYDSYCPLASDLYPLLAGTDSVVFENLQSLEVHLKNKSSNNVAKCFLAHHYPRLQFYELNASDYILESIFEEGFSKRNERRQKEKERSERQLTLELTNEDWSNMES